MLVGYMRVSKADGTQTVELQRDALLAAGVEVAHLYDDHAPGRRDDRPGLASCLKALRDGDTLVVWKLDRLGRNLHHLVNTVHDLTARGVGLKVLTGQGAAIDTTTPAGKLVFAIFAALAEFERELISERTTAGLASARARGRNGGRPYKMTPAKLRLATASMGKPDTTVGELCAELGVSRQTLYRHVSPDRRAATRRAETACHRSQDALRPGHPGPPWFWRMGGLSRPPPVGPACVSARVFVRRLPNLPGGWSGVTRAPASMRVARCRCLADGGSRVLRALGSGEQVQRSWSCRCVPSWVQVSASESRSRMTLPIRLPSASRAESTTCVPWSSRA